MKDLSKLNNLNELIELLNNALIRAHKISARCDKVQQRKDVQSLTAEIADYMQGTNALSTYQVTTLISDTRQARSYHKAHLHLTHLIQEVGQAIGADCNTGNWAMFSSLTLPQTDTQTDIETAKTVRKPMQFIYSRVSTAKQSTEAQTDTLTKHYPNAIVKVEKASGMNLERPIWQKLNEQLQEGDTVIVYDLSRLGRETSQILEMVKDFKLRNVSLIIHNLGGDVVDTSSVMGELFITIIAGINKMQRDIQEEKAQLGRERAMAEGKFTGRKKGSKGTMAELKRAEIRELVELGHTWADIESERGYSKSTIARALR